MNINVYYIFQAPVSIRPSVFKILNIRKINLPKLREINLPKKYIRSLVIGLLLATLLRDDGNPSQTGALDNPRAIDKPPTQFDSIRIQNPLPKITPDPSPPSLLTLESVIQKPPPKITPDPSPPSLLTLESLETRLIPGCAPGKVRLFMDWERGKRWVRCR